MRTIKLYDLKLGQSIQLDEDESIRITGLFHDAITYEQVNIAPGMLSHDSHESDYKHFSHKLNTFGITVVDFADHCNLGGLEPISKMESDKQIMQEAISVLMMHSDGDFVSKATALNAGSRLHNLMIKLDADQPRIYELINEEVIRAQIKHPVWPEDVIYKAAIVSEESGELMLAAVQYEMEGGDIEEVRTEAIQTAATCIRLLLNLPDGKRTESQLVDPLKEENERLRSIIEKTDRALKFYDAEFTNRGLYNDMRKMMQRAINGGY